MAMLAKTRSHVVLHLWDYFYVANSPRPGDERVWASVERATGRIREAEIYLDAPTPADVRLRNALRMRAAIRVANRNMDRLSARVERWVIDQLAQLEALTFAAEAQRLVLD